MLTTVLAFLVTIAILVVIHEYGHYRAAVACDVKVLRFSVGFGRVLWRRQRGETEFVVSALPLGGYVKMLDEREGVVPPAELHRAFNRKPLSQRAFVVAAGPAANLLLAAVLYAIVNWAGVQELRARVGAPQAASVAAEAGLQAGDEVLALAPAEGEGAWVPVRSLSDLQRALTEAVLDGSDVRLQVARRGLAVAADGSDGVADVRGEDVRPAAPTHELLLRTSRVPVAEVDAELMARLGLAGPFMPPVIGQVMDGGPAQAAGLQQGDLIVAIDGRRPSDGAQAREWIMASAPGGRPAPLRFDVLRDGRSVSLTVAPELKTEEGASVPRIMAQIGARPESVEVHYGFAEGLGLALHRIWKDTVLTLNLLAKMIIGEASLKNLSGPLTIADYAGKSAELGLPYFLNFLAVISVSLGVLNLLPLPVLDGGHLMYYLFEGVTGRPVSDAWLARLQRGGVAVMLLMMSLALYNDFARLLGAH